MRTAVSLALTVGLVVSLAACSPSSPAADCDVIASGAASDAVKVAGDFGAKPDVTIGTLKATTETERTVAIVGDGETVTTGDVITADYTLFNATTGEELGATEYTESSAQEVPVDGTQVPPGVAATLACSQVGSRVVGVIPPVDFAGADEDSAAQDYDIVFVVDVVSIKPEAAPVLPKADGADQSAPEGFPTVVLADDGTPTVTIPDTAPPTELKIALLKKGTGTVVADGDDVTVHYVGVNWNTKKIFDSSWSRGEPASFNTGGVIAGFTKALVGQAVGSQVIVIIPPAEGYGEAGSPPDIGGTDTIVFVVDILGIG